MSSGIETTGTAHRVSRLTRVEAMFPSEEDRLRNPENTAPQVAQPALILEESAKADGVRRAMLNVNDAISMVQEAARGGLLLRSIYYVSIRLPDRSPSSTAPGRPILARPQKKVSRAVGPGAASVGLCLRTARASRT